MARNMVAGVLLAMVGKKNWEWRGPPGWQHRLLHENQVTLADSGWQVVFYLSSLGQTLMDTYRPPAMDSMHISLNLC